MGSMKKTVLRLLLRLSTFFGYMFLFISWAWVVVFYMPLLFRMLGTKTCLQPTPMPVDTPMTISMPEPVSIGVIILTVVIVLLVTGIALWRLPRSVMKTGGTITHASAGVIVPVLHRSETPLKPAEKKKLTAKALMIIKLVLSLSPVLLTLPLRWLDVSLPSGAALSFELMLLLVSLSVIGALGAFVVQAIVSRFLKLRYETIE